MCSLAAWQAQVGTSANTGATFAQRRSHGAGNVLSLARHHKGKLATFDKGIAELIQANKERRRHITEMEA
jgi:hypothetical protein